MKTYFFMIAAVIILLANSCSEKQIKVKKIFIQNIPLLEIISSSGDDAYKLVGKDSWYSTSFPLYETILFGFSEPVFISYMEINTNADSLMELTVLVNGKKKIVSDFSHINLNRKTNFVILLFSRTSNMLTKVIPDSINSYFLSFDDFSYPVRIENINFFDTLGNPLNFTFLRKVKKSKAIYGFQKRNFVYANKDRLYSVSLSPSGDFTLYKTDSIGEDFLFGQWQRGIDLKLYTPVRTNGIRYRLTEKKMKIAPFEKEFHLAVNYLEDSELGKIIFFPESDNIFILLRTYDTNFVYDIRYATDSNFAGRKLYPCAECMLRYAVAKDLTAANYEFMKYGYRIKLFDCYRPFSVQVRMWNIVHNKNYVAPPDIGSSHNRGSAIDITLIDTLGNEIDFGTPYDYFGKEAWTINTALPEEIIQRREFLQKILKKHNFNPIKTEWWHFFHSKTNYYPLENLPLPCN